MLEKKNLLQQCLFHFNNSNTKKGHYLRGSLFQSFICTLGHVPITLPHSDEQAVGLPFCSQSFAMYPCTSWHRAVFVLHVYVKSQTSTNSFTLSLPHMNTEYIISDTLWLLDLVQEVR